MLKKLPNAPKSPIKFWGIVLGIPLVFIISIVIMFAYQGSTKPILDVANQFNPGDGWMLESEQVEPPRIVCLNSVPCPSVARAWVTEEALKSDDIKKILTMHSQGGVVNMDDCSDEDLKGGLVCTIDSSKEGYFVQAYLENVEVALSQVNGSLKVFIRKI